MREVDRASRTRDLVVLALIAQLFPLDAAALGLDLRRVFDRLRDLDREAVRLLTGELTEHVRSNKFPLHLSD
jgi:hypothetical protein